MGWHLAQEPLRAQPGHVIKITFKMAERVVLAFFFWTAGLEYSEISNRVLDDCGLG